MHPLLRLGIVALAAGVLVTPALGAETTDKALPTEIPDQFTPTNPGFDYERRTVEIPMRDGVKLHTVIVLPKGATHAGILLTRTPYGADGMAHRNDSPHLGTMLRGYDNPADIIVQDGYIRVVQ